MINKADTDTASGLVDSRVAMYGDPVTSHADVAQMWSAFLGHEVQAWEVPIMMMLVKVIRLKSSPDYSDHGDDIGGYLDIYRKIIGEDMVHARTAAEYTSQK